MNGYTLAERIYRYARERKTFFNYTGILNLQGLERLAHLSGDATHRELALKRILLLVLLTAERC